MKWKDIEIGFITGKQRINGKKDAATAAGIIIMSMSSTSTTPIRTFLDLTAGGISIGRLTFQLRDDICPKTCENFRALCTGEKGFGYKGCLFYRVIPGFCACSGDFETNNADRSGGRSIFGEKYFEDENFILKHDSRGVLSMDNYGWPNTVSSRFFITFDEAPWLNDYHVAFGNLIDGFDTLDRLESYGILEGYGAQKGRTTATITIENCGQIL